MSMTAERETEIRDYLRGFTQSEKERLPYQMRVLFPKVVDLLAAYDALKADSTAQAAEIATLKSALSGRTVSCDHCNTTSAENERLKAEVERLTDELSNATSDLLSAGGEIQDLEFRLDAAVKEIESARQQ